MRWQVAAAPMALELSKTEKGGALIRRNPSFGHDLARAGEVGGVHLSTLNGDNGGVASNSNGGNKTLIHSNSTGNLNNKLNAAGSNATIDNGLSIQIGGGNLADLESNLSPTLPTPRRIVDEQYG